MSETDDRIAAIRGRARHATPGPWYRRSGPPNGEAVHWSEDGQICPMRWTDGMRPAVEQRVADDAEFIAHAREDVPCLLNLLATQAADLEALRASIVDHRAEAHGDGQMHAIADVNAGRVDDLIAPRLEALRRERDGARAVLSDVDTKRAEWKRKVLAHAADLEALRRDSEVVIGGDGPPVASCVICGVNGPLAVWYGSTRHGACESCRSAKADLEALRRERDEARATASAEAGFVRDEMAKHEAAEAERVRLREALMAIRRHATATCEREGFGADDTDDMIAIKELAEVALSSSSAWKGE